VERSPHSQSFHDKMIKLLADSLVSKKFRDVKADHPDFAEKPAPISLEAFASSYIPDVTATGIQMVIFEVETDETIIDDHTGEQWKLFSSYAHLNAAEFWVVVPKASMEDAEQRLANLGLHGKVMGF
jgi:hypothetical protein